MYFVAKLGTSLVMSNTSCLPSDLMPPATQEPVVKTYLPKVCCRRATDNNTQLCLHFSAGKGLEYGKKHSTDGTAAMTG